MMEKLPYKVTSWDDLEELKGQTFKIEDLYQEAEEKDGGGLVLAVSGAVDKSFRQNNIDLLQREKQHAKELDELRSANDALEEDKKALVNEINTLKERQREAKQSVEEEDKMEISRLREKVRTLELEKSEAENNLAGAKEANYNLQFDQQFQAVADKYGIKKNPRVRATVRDELQRSFRLKDGRFSPEDSDGELTLDDRGDPYTLDTWMETFRVENDDWAFETPKGLDGQPGDRRAGRSPGLTMADLADPAKMTMETLQDVLDGKRTVL